MRRVLVLAAAVAAATACGCANARYVQKAGDEGVIAIRSNTDTWPDYNRSNAMKMIESHVGPGFEIVEEKEVVTGSVTNNTQQTKEEATFNSEIPILPASKQTTTTMTTSTPVTEYQIHYRRSAGGLTRFPGGGLPAAYPTPPASEIVQTSHTAPAVGHTPASVSPASLTAGSPALPPPNLTGLGVGASR